MSDNPYQTPEFAHLPPQLPGALDAVAIREQHLSTEASIKGLGGLYVLSGSLLFLSGVGTLVVLVVQKAGGFDGQSMEPVVGIMSVVYLGLSVLHFLTGLALRKFKPWARIVAIVFAAIGLLLFPVGTLIGGYILYLLAGRKGNFIFTPAYQEIMAATPGMKYKTSIIVWIVLSIFIVSMVLGVVLLLARGPR